MNLDMALYMSTRFLHILGAVVCLGAIVCLPVLAAARHKSGPTLDRLVGIGGWALVLSGGGLLHLRGWSDVHAPWFVGAMGVLVATLALERIGERRAWAGQWPWLRVALYVAILALMVFKP